AADSRDADARSSSDAPRECRRRSDGRHGQELREPGDVRVVATRSTARQGVELRDGRRIGGGRTAAGVDRVATGPWRDRVAGVGERRQRTRLLNDLIAAVVGDGAVLNRPGWRTTRANEEAATTKPVGVLGG